MDIAKYIADRWMKKELFGVLTFHFNIKIRIGHLDDFVIQSTSFWLDPLVELRGELMRHDLRHSSVFCL